MVDDLHSHFIGRYLPHGVWSERQLCGTHDGFTSTNRYSGYDLCAESGGSAQTATQSVTASSGKLLDLTIMREIDALLVAPTTRSTSFPPLNRIKVGMPLIPYVAAVDGLSSTFSTGFSDFRTSCSKDLSVTSLTLSFILVIPSYFSFPVRNARKFLLLTLLLPFTS